ncbi:ABC transporter ATP-binding protein [Ilumatobacter sp.]|uniref:ABC transporter ATP-binding protein n=1 Tax=Ilumatobacter sp. TaxID=1967498 RepID=UPI0037509714
MSHLRVDQLGVLVGERLLIDGLDLSVDTGRFVGLVGPNGSGKSTLLKSIYRVLAPIRGVVSLDERDIASFSARAVAREIAVVAQEVPTDLEFTVHEIVMLGRLPHQRSLARPTSADDRLVDDALDQVDIAHLSDRSWQTLSGGEKQRVLLARALAQQGNIIILDEPTNHLDIRHQLELLTLTKSLGTTTIAALHDLNLAAEFCDEVVVLDNGAIVAHGTPDDVFVDDVITPVFGVTTDRVVHPRTGAIRLLFSTLAAPCTTSTAPAPTAPDLEHPLLLRGAPS